MNKNVFIISYDLGFPTRMYKMLDEFIAKAFPTHVRILQSTWLIVGSDALDAALILKILKPALDADDKMLVIPVNPAWAHWNLDPEHVQWLQSHLSV